MTSHARSRPFLLDPWRRIFQWLTTLTILLIPWFNINGIGVLRINLDSLTLHLFGQILRIEELYLFLFFSLWLILFFLLITLVFGRVWCGWACPQTTLSDISEWLAHTCGLIVSNHRINGSPVRKILLHACYASLSLLVGCNLVWYFIEPIRFFGELSRFELHPGAWVSVVVIATTVYLDLAVIRRMMCRDFCPYGRFQTALVDPGTLTLHIPASEQQRCIECGSCVRSCPMEIDIRRGYQVECINCGRCLDACRKVMHERHQEGLVRYSFGIENKGMAALLHPRTIVLAAATLLLCVILVAGIVNRGDASLKISVSHTAESRVLSDDKQVTFFTAWINNRSTRTLNFSVKVQSETESLHLELKGQTRDLVLTGGENRRIEFALLSDAVARATPVKFILTDDQATGHDQVIATILPVEPRDL